MTEVSYSSPAQTLIPHKRGPGPLKHVQSAHSSSSCFHLMIISHTLSRSYSSGQYSFNTTRIYNRSLLTRKGLLENCLWPRRIFICIIIINLVRHCILLKKKKKDCVPWHTALFSDVVLFLNPSGHQWLQTQASSKSMAKL